MSLQEFQAYVRRLPSRFHGAHPESGSSLVQAERMLGVSLPESMKWLLTEWGYGEAAVIDSLEGCVEITLRCRLSCGTPNSIVVLNDWQDAVVVWTDRAQADADGESPVYWSGAHNFLRLGSGMDFDGEVDEYADFPAWVRARVAAVEND